MALVDNLTNTGFTFIGVTPIGTGNDHYYYFSLNNNVQTQVQNPNTGDFTPASFRQAPSWYLGLGVSVGSSGSFTISIDGSNDLAVWNPISSEFLTWEYHELENDKMKRLESVGDTYILDSINGSQVRLYAKRCEYTYYRVNLLTSALYVDGASVGVVVATDCERYTGFDKLDV